MPKLIEPQAPSAQQEAIPQDETATPEEQALYDKVVISAMHIIHGRSSRDSILDMLKTGEPAKAIGATAARVIELVQKGAGSAGQDIPEDVLINAGGEIIEQLTDLAVGAGAVEAQSDAQIQSIHEQAVVYGIQAYSSNKHAGDAMAAEGEMPAPQASGDMASPQEMGAPPVTPTRGMAPSAMADSKPLPNQHKRGLL